jgi:putative proteasome-type protease
MRSNLTVGPPIELLIYPAGSMSFGKRLILREDNRYLRELHRAWQAGLKETFDRLPPLPIQRPRVKLVEKLAGKPADT